jgi:hypothetical protein
LWISDVYCLFADKTTSQNVCISFFSIFAGGATFIGVVLAVSEFRLKFEKITDWKDLLQELTHLVNEAHKYVVMYTFYPSVGMVSQRRGDDFIPEFNDFYDALNVRRNEVKFVCYFLKNTDLEKELKDLSARYEYPGSTFFEEKATKVISDLRSGSSSSHKNIVKEELILDKMSDFHLLSVMRRR